ncbi:acyl-CoA dehydrogenase family protein [Paraburkholderia phenoliruptrix]|uniref:acyl-CoA dehydrogenase family protein n=1 Tax=Paraburkholderia phenoliruptrix TaxID=252970 RepID=UPI001C6E72F1|nr:acyl-CoA dehydrogenase family protein [Paraburkholderia phenoliruptrix]MBW9107787.1 acyl-CoA/acyl-ACP dehydrogenase [Paraburkholderia phenoliruptrix]MBW9133005.1 acyl-CoA/acyl-ACP dehydrogenase [Paraburkholderia ginsengiterrae]
MLLQDSRAVLEQYAPGLDGELAEQGLLVMEGKEPAAIRALIRRYRLPRLWVPSSLGGAAISPYDGIRMQRAVAARAPSMALMLTMHNFTVSFCNALAAYVPCCERMLRDVAHDDLLVASAFAEGRRGAGILDSTVYMTPDGADFLIDGSKKPCTMSGCMDIITVGVAVKTPDGGKRTGLAVLPAGEPGVTQRPFWSVPLLAAADNHELRFDKVRVSADQVLLAAEGDNETAQVVASAEVLGLCWFEIVASASYLGAVSGMAERVVADTGVDETERVLLGGELESAQAALDGAVHLMQTCEPNESLLARVLMIRFGVQRIIERCAMQAAELAGGLAFVRDRELMTQLAISRCLAFHPISRKAARPLLAAWLEAGASGPSAAVAAAN